ncbi:histidine phosphatase family protein [Vibrio sonorensis]|uniref:histidine phosphatase family protein n=1 Tax=Vibrio sonorensis TaxID=1004316 RepID=UPI0008D9E264|nr:histidine phosphatase family protein [Vibrio sonorensis]
MISTQFYLVRHGKTLGEAALNGVTDVKVDARHQRSIAQSILSKNLGYERIYASPLSRCRDLGDLLTNSDTPLDIAPDLAEMNFGEFDGVPFSQLAHRWDELEAFWRDPQTCQFKDGESLTDFFQRVVAVWKKIKKATSQDSLIIAHGGTIRMILAYELDVDWKNPKWFSTLSLGHHSLSHISVSGEGEFSQVKTVGQPLDVEDI